MATEARDRARTVGRYEVLGELGRGGSATVYLARQTDLGRLVALKELSSLPVTDPTTVRRFVRESRLAGSLNDPNIVTVHDFFDDRGTPYIAMEYLARGSLRPLMHELTFAQIAGVLEGLLSGLGHAQEHGIVHRDLKPENLMVTADGRIKIADFGIAKVIDPARAGTVLTEKGTTIGTPTYMAPELAMGRDIGPWTDMYAVGVIAFELLAGRPPFDTTGTPMAILLRHVNEAPLELASLDPSLDPRLSEWIDSLLVKEPEARRHSASAAWLALEEIVLDLLGPRWRHKARLTPPAPVGPTPATMPMAHDEARDQRDIPTTVPRAAAPDTVSAALAARPRDGRSARPLRRSILLVIALLVGVGVLALPSGNGSGTEGSTATPVREPSVTRRRARRHPWHAVAARARRRAARAAPATRSRTIRATTSPTSASPDQRSRDLVGPNRGHDLCMVALGSFCARTCLATLRIEPASPGELLCVVGLFEVRDLHDVAGMRGVDEPVPADGHPDVVHVARRVAEEDEVPRQQSVAADLGGARSQDLLVRDAGDPDAGLRVRPLDQPGAVEARLRRRAAPAIGSPEIPPSLGERLPGARAGTRGGTRLVDELLRGHVLGPAVQ